MMKYLLLLLILIVGDIYHAILRCITRALGLFGYLYLLRIPVIVMAVMIAFPLLSWLGPMRALTVGGYEVLDFWHAFFAAIVFVLASGSAYTVALSFAQGTGLRYSGTPFQVSQKSIGWWKLAFRFSILGNVIWMLAASWDSVGEKTAIIAGVVSGLGASWVVRLLLPFFVDLFSAWFSTPLAGLYHRFGAGAGIVRKKSNNTLALELGQDRLHVYALIITGMCVISTFNGLVTEYASAVSAIFLLLAVIIYIGGLLAFALDLYRVPLILFVVAYCAFMTQWRESDHFYAVHHPSSPPGASSSLTPPAPSAAEPSIAEDRYFLQSGSSREYLGLPAQFLGRKGKLIREEAVRNPTARAKPLVVISLAGGGIQAAAWPLAVLERIEGEIPAFHDRVCLISGVSGGSVGAMYYAHACTLADKNPGPFACATEAAQASSLAEVTLAFLGSEFRKVALPLLLRENPHGSWSVLADRGLALEKTFGDNARKCFGESPPYLADATLTSWRSEAFANRMPALIFNGTVAETGERISFSTVPRNTRYTPGTVEFTTRYLGGLNMTTAARLSATFPFVSPAARPAVATPQRVKVVPGIDSWRIFPDGGSCLHVVDGGYFEVSGVIGALAWLEEAMEQLAQVTSYQDATGKNASEFFELPPRIIFLQMSGFPVTDLGAAKDEGGNTSGAIFDLISPVIAAINIRDGVQASFPDELLRVFTKRWGATSTSGAPPQVEFEHIIIQPELNIDDLSIKPATTTGFLPQSPPLSWHLRVSEKLKLQEQVAKTMKSPQIKKLKDSILSIP